MSEITKMSQLELCKKVDKILSELYNNRYNDNSDLDWGSLIQPPRDAGLLDMNELTPFLEETPDISITEKDLKFFAEFEYEGFFSNHQDDNWQETIRVSRHGPTGHLIGVRSIYSSYGHDDPYPDDNGLLHCFPVRPIRSWDYGGYDPSIKMEVEDA